RVTSSSATDTYSSIAAGIGSLKGPKHGGANIKVMEMIKHIREGIRNPEDEDEIRAYLDKILRREVGDRSGLIYGIGHAVYTKSDPRAVLLKEMAHDLAVEKGRQDEYAFMERLERLAIETVYARKGTTKTLCANVDFYSGFVYDLIGLPVDIYTPLFAMARIVGWCAHRNEELNFEGKRIIRPAYRCVADINEYVPIARR
ncbi:MAG: citrate/2-methylcitrate synthase, partial [Alloprevotella sp.]|nr:citrate/2-methylcitrate synthase [Alloprevotella sp.]